MTNKAILIICLTIAAIAASPAKTAAQEKVTVDKIVANVGNSVILYSDVIETEVQMINDARMNGYAPPKNTFYAAFEQLLEIKLGYNQALIDSVLISESDLVNYVEEVVQRQINDAGSVKELQERYNMPIFDIKDVVYKRLEEQEYYKSMQREVTGKINITPGEVETFFRSFPSDSIPLIPDQYMYAHITKYPPTMAEAKQLLRERMLSMREDIITGKSKFETLAVLYSIDQESGKRGGELEPMSKNEMDPAFWNSVRKLKPGQISEVTETENGLHLIQLIDIAGDRHRIRHLLMTPDYTSEEKYSAVNMLDSVATKIRQDSITFANAALLYSDDKATRMNGGIVTNADLLMQYYGSNISAGMTSFRFKKEDFIGAFYWDYQKLKEMKVGEVSNAFLTTDFRGNPEAKIVKLIEFYPAHEANLADDYLVLEAEARNQKRMDAYSKWLNKTIEATYIRIDPAYRDGIDPKWIK